MKGSVPAGPAGLLRVFGRVALDFLYPPICLGCEVRLSAQREVDGLPLCSACLRQIPRAEAGALDARLGALPGGSATFGHAVALWFFDDEGALQHVQHALKYGNRPSLGVRLGRLVGEAWREAEAPLPDLVVPVPLSRRRRLERGYNQSERIGQGLADALGVPLRTDLLTRSRPTRSQTALGQAARWHNVDGAFSLADDAGLAGSRVLLVDDVFTTGATAVAAATPLRAAGASVDLALLACTRE